MSLTSSINEIFNTNNLFNIGLKKISKKRNKFHQNKISSSSVDLLKTKNISNIYLNPNYTIYEKKSLGSIPVEKNLIKQEIKSYNNKNNISLINSNSKKILAHIPPPPTIFQNPKNYTTSYSSKGFGIGFVSKVSRFKNIQNISGVGPGDYYPEKHNSIENNVNKSNFGQSIFFKKKCKSIINNNENYKNDNNNVKIYRNNFKINKNLKQSFYFESTSERFNDNIINGVGKNNNPGPGRYLKFKDYIKQKDYYKLSPGFVCEKPKAVNLIKKYVIDENDNKKYGYCIYNKEKNGKIIKGIPPLSVIRKYFNSFQNFNNNTSDITLDLSNSINKTQKMKKYKIYKIENIKNICSFGEQNWDDKLSYNNNSHFKIPGPAYYFPRLLNTKKSFNSNTKDFIFVNSSMDLIDDRKYQHN